MRNSMGDSTATRTTQGASALSLLGLDVQDRVWTGSSNPLQTVECAYFVECVDLEANVVHVLTGSGDRRKLQFSDILDVQKCVSPVEVTVGAEIWDAHQCDPAYLGKPVKAVGAMLSEKGALRGLFIPKWPGKMPGTVLTLDLSIASIGMDEKQLLQTLPTNRSIRYHDPERMRNEVGRTAKQRISKFIASRTNGGRSGCTAIDPSLKQKNGLLEAL